MTAFRLVDLEEPKVVEVLRQMERFQPIGHAILNRTGVIQVGEKLISTLFRHALHRYITLSLIYFSRTKLQKKLVRFDLDFLDLNFNPAEVRRLKIRSTLLTIQ